MNQPTFSGLIELRERHLQLLAQRRDLDTAQSASFWEAVSQFVSQGQASGVHIDLDDERNDAQTLLDYWSNELYRADYPALEATLAEYDPEQAPELDDSLCPYVGLDAFQASHSNYFFGRDRLIGRMLEKLEHGRFLAIIGPSGSGKSSAVMAGLLPRLRGSARPGYWSHRRHQKPDP